MAGNQDVATLAALMRSHGVDSVEFHADGTLRAMKLGLAPVAVAEPLPEATPVLSTEEKAQRERAEADRIMYAASTP